MLYDGALRFVGDARAALARNDVKARADAISRTLAIIAELQNTLDLEKGGAIAVELDRLYTYLTARLLDVTVQKNAAALDDVHKVLSTLRDGWAQIVPGGAPNAKP